MDGSWKYTVWNILWKIWYRKESKEFYQVSEIEYCKLHALVHFVANKLAQLDMEICSQIMYYDYSRILLI